MNLLNKTKDEEGIKWLKEQRICLWLEHFLKVEGTIEDEQIKPFLTHNQTIKINQLAWLGEFNKIVTAFNVAKIDFIPFKGPVLAKRLYNDWNGRQFRDLDILFPSIEEFEKARLLLHDLGYVDMIKGFKNRLDEYFHFENHFNLEKPNTPFILECHISLQKEVNKKTLNTAQKCFKNAIKFNFQGNPIKVLSKQDLAEFLWFHGFKHHWLRLHWLLDYHTLRNDTDIDWSFEEPNKKKAFEALVNYYLYDMPLDIGNDYLITQQDAFKFGTRGRNGRIRLYKLKFHNKTSWHKMIYFIQIVFKPPTTLSAKLGWSKKWMYYPLMPFWRLYRIFTIRQSD